MPFTADEIGQMADAGMKPDDIHKAEIDFDAKSVTPAGPSRGEMALAGAIPGGQTYEAFKNPASTGMDKLGAASGDLLNAGLMLGSGGTAGALKQAALNAGGGALAPELAKASSFGGDIGRRVLGFSPLAKMLPENSPNMGVEIAKNLPGTIGEIAGTTIPSFIAMALGKGLKSAAEPSMKPVPQAENGQALMNVVKDKFPGETPMPEATNKGNINAGLKATRTELGQPIKQVKETIAAQPLPEGMVPDIQDALLKSGAKVVNGKIVPELSQNKAAAKLISDTLDASHGIDDFQSAQNLRDQLKEALSDSYKPGAVSNLKSPILKNAISGLDKVLEKYTPDEMKGKLAEANKPFSQFASVQDVINKSFTGSQVNPKKFINNWNSISDAEKLQKFEPEQVDAIDALVKQQDPSAIQNGLMKLASLSHAGGLSRIGNIFTAAADTKPKFYQETPAMAPTRALGAVAPSPAQVISMTQQQAAQRARQLSQAGAR